MPFNNSYPLEILTNPGYPYVYFNSLPDEILNQVASYFEKDITTFNNTKTNISSIDEAFSFIQSAIATERAKEEAFIRYLKEKTQNTIKLEIPEINSDWSDFVREMQEIISFGNTGLRNLQNEYDRLKKNEENFTQAQAEGKQQAWYEQDSLTKTSKQLQNIIKEFKEKSHNAARLSNIILETVVDRYKDSLITIQDNKLGFNKGELAALILSVTHIVLSVYNMQTYDLTPSSQRKYTTKDSINKILDEANIDEKVQNFIKQFQTIPSFKQDILNNYNLQSTNRGNKLSAKPFTDNTGKILSDSRQLTQVIESTLQNYEFPEKAIKLIQTTNALAEVESSLKFAVNGALKVANTGSAGAKPDNILGFLTFDINAISVFSQEKQNQIITTAEAIIERIDNLVESLSKENTTSYYQKQAEQWNRLQPEIDNLLASLKDIFDFLPSCFIIEDSTKNYLSLYSRMEDGELSNAPHGGSLGARLDDQLDKIRALTDAGAISMVDQKWLTACIINAGPDMIASHQKSLIENYLALFAAILLFDGQINIAQEAMHYMTEQQMSATNTHQIHLFSVNNGYYPLSYVLNLTYTSLNKNLTRIENETRSQGVQVEIYGFTSKPSPQSYQGLQSWEETSKAALKSTKIKMKFLVQFQNIVANLLNLQ